MCIFGLNRLCVTNNFLYFYINCNIQKLIDHQIGHGGDIIEGATDTMKRFKL